MLPGEDLVLGRAGAVGLRIAPAIEDPPAFAAAPARTRLGFGRRRGVVEDPDLAEVPHRDRDLIEVGVVGERVGMGPIAVAVHRVPVEVSAARMLRDVAEVRLVRVEVLDEVIPNAPFPHDLATARAGRRDFDDRVDHEIAVGEFGGISARGEGFGVGLDLPEEHQEVAVGHAHDVVVQGFGARSLLIAPDDIAVPVELLDDAALTAGEAPDLRVGRAQEIAVGQEVGDHTCEILALPAMHRAASLVDQMDEAR
jgi:hypothetical protein